MDVVYPYRKIGNGDELRYSLRSLANLPHDTVWVVGDRLPWFQGIEHISVQQNAGSKWQNSRRNITTAAQDDRVSESFVLMNDDFYVMQPIDEVPPYHRGTLQYVIEEKYRNVKSRYVQGMSETKKMVQDHLNISNPLCYELHVPMVIEKEKWLEAITCAERINPEMKCLHARSWYGNYWQIGGIQMEDVKVNQQRPTFNKDSIFLSTSDSAFRWRGRGAVRDHLTSSFPNRCDYEGPSLPTPVSSRSARRANRRR